MDRDISRLFARDGLAHPAYSVRKTAIFGRRDFWSDATYKDAAVCLSCTADECEGETKCFRRRLVETRAGLRLKTVQGDPARLPVGVLLDDLIYADEVCEDGRWTDDLPWE